MGEFAPPLSIDMPTKDEVYNFSLSIEKIVHDKKMPYMDAIIHHCDSIGLEIELAAKLISSSIRTKVKSEAEGLHFLPKSDTKRLPVEED